MEIRKDLMADTIEKRHAEIVSIKKEHGNFRNNKECFSSTPLIQVSYIRKRGRHFMWTKITQENRLKRTNRLLNKVKHPEEQECLWFLSDQKTSTRMKKSIEEMIGGYCLKVNAEADAYVESLQTIVVKLSWIDSVANGTPPPSPPPISSNMIRLHLIKL
ncbi:hypothetical protein ACTXT7_006459 [Hymenolepis weldensis]